jgi:spore maturation protein CgeB
VRRANRDDHVMRTFELPACGAFMLTERTDTHLELFEEDREAAHFSSPDEMVSKVRYYLTHDCERMRIAEAGYRKLAGGHHTYDHRLAQIVAETLALR